MNIDRNKPSWRASLTHLASLNVITVMFLSFSSGLPMPLSSSTLQAWFQNAGINIETIGLLGLASLPYTLKVFWAPLIDRWTLPWLTRRRDWMLATQVILAILLVAMGWLNPTTSPLSMGILALFIALFSATQDIAINGYQTDLFTKEERGIGATYTIVGYRIGMVVSNGLALILSQYYGWQITYWTMAGFMGIGIATTLLAPKPVYQDLPEHPSFAQTVIEPFRDLIQRFDYKVTLLILLMIVFYKFGDAFAMALNTPFLLGGVGFSNAQVGSISKIFGLGATIVGGLVGGTLMTRMRLITALWYFGWLQLISNFGYLVLTLTGPNLSALAITVGFENFTSGLGTAAFLALVMALCNKRFSATQFALLTAISAIGRAYLPPVAGFIVAHIGWAWLYSLSLFVSLPGMGLLYLLQKEPRLQGYL